MISENELIEIGQFVKPHGIKGEILAELYQPIEFDAIKFVIVSIDGIFVPFFVDAFRMRSSQSVLLMIDGISSELDAKTLANKKIYIKKDQFPSNDLIDEDDEGRVYISEFVGYELLSGNERIGEIIDIDDATENILFIVSPLNKNINSNIFVPIVDELIDTIDTDNKRIFMNLPEGLIDLNK